MKRLSIILSVWVVVFFAFAATTFAESISKEYKSGQKSKSQKQRKKNRKKTGRRKPVTPEQEEVALKFAKKHHPELAELLLRLKERRKNQYQRAVRQIFTTSERLGRIKKNSPGRFEQQLKTWKLDSRIRLLMARSAMGEGDQHRDKIRKMVAEKIQLRIEQLKSELERAKNRLDRIQHQLDQMQSNSEATIEKEITRLKRTLGKRKPKRRKKRTKKKDKIEN